MGLRTFLKGLTGGGELTIDDTQTGDGEEAVPGMKVVVHYTGRLTDGTVFDSSRSRVQPFEFVLGAGQVIDGWDQGIEGMRVGGKRTLTIPSRLGYGRRGSPPSIPGGATLVFDVELVGIRGGNRSGMPC